MLADVKADRDSKELYQDPKFNLDKIISDLSLLKAETDAIFALPPPKEEKPNEEDVKMEDTNLKAPDFDSDDKAPDSKLPDGDLEMKPEGGEPPKAEDPPK